MVNIMKMVLDLFKNGQTKTNMKRVESVRKRIIEKINEFREVSLWMLLTTGYQTSYSNYKTIKYSFDLSFLIIFSKYLLDTKKVLKSTIWTLK